MSTSSVQRLDHHSADNIAIHPADTKTLGGAGFASQAWRPSGKSTDSDRPNRLDLPASRYAGLRITYLPIPSRPVTRFTLVLKTKIGHRRPDGRLQSELSWERTIDASSSASSSSAGFSESRIASRAPASLEIPWADFAATYRGRPISPDDPEYYPFVPGREPGGDKGDEDAEGIAEISLMCRSAFGKQEGDFEFIIVSLEATAASKVSSPSASVVASDVEKAASDAEKNEESSILDHQNDDGHPHRDDGRSFFRALWEMCASVAGQAVTLLGQGWQWIGSWLKYLTGSGGVRLD